MSVSIINFSAPTTVIRWDSAKFKRRLSRSSLSLLPSSEGLSENHNIMANRRIDGRRRMRIASEDEPAAHPIRVLAMPERTGLAKKVALRISDVAAKAKIAIPMAKKTHIKRRVALVLHPVPGSGNICYWDGCGADLGDGRDVWAHMKTAHNSGRSSVGKKMVLEPKELEEPDTTVIAGDVQAEGKMEVDELQDEEITDTELGEDEKGPPDITSTEDDLSLALLRGKKKSTPNGCWAEKVRCFWEGCASEMQYPALRRHVESKHVPLRRASCPKGCGYNINRADMLKRHADKCRYVGPPRKDAPESGDGR
ncbi:hypothetical protein C8Q79DRAFT_974223 [Trametes meyenii]|nr:hypothetical protein C8Q79DRAFT_974223 [Trametes meyenii]